MEKWCLINLTLLPTGFLYSYPHSPLSLSGVSDSWVISRWPCCPYLREAGGEEAFSTRQSSHMTSLGQTQTKFGTVPKTQAFLLIWTGNCILAASGFVAEKLSDSTFGEMQSAWNARQSLWFKLWHSPRQTESTVVKQYRQWMREREHQYQERW